MEQTLIELLKQSPTVAVLLIVLKHLFGLYTTQLKNYENVILELKGVIRDNTIAINDFAKIKKRCDFLEEGNSSHYSLE